MSKRRSSPTDDLLGNIPRKTPEPDTPEKDRKIPKEKDSKIAKKQNAKEEKKKSNTYYLTEDTFWRLDEAKAKLRRMSGENISKSDIIEWALVIALDELDQRGEDSYLAIKISKL
jgi:hypothetical protein